MDEIIIRGAREHNLKNVNLTIPRNKLVVFTGLSGSGKSSLAYDTLYAEGQRRYVESLSAYARQFLGRMEKPDVDQIEGLSPAISIDQKGASHNPRSTVGTVTEIYDYLRLLFARAGIPHCPECGRVIAQQSPQQIVDAVQLLPDRTRIQILAPLVLSRKGTHLRVFDDIRKEGYVRVRVDGDICDVNDNIELDRYKVHTIEAVVDRLVVSHDAEEEDESRLADSIETALKLGGGIVIVNVADRENPRDLLFSEHFACVHCGISLGEIEPRSFSFNSPHGACPTCQGLGIKQEISQSLVIPNLDLTLSEGAIAPWSRATTSDGFFSNLLQAVSKHYNFSLDRPWIDLSAENRDIILYGSKGQLIKVRYKSKAGRLRTYETAFEGVIPNLERRHKETTSDYMRSEIERYMAKLSCPSCKGTRLKPESRAVRVADRGIAEITSMSVQDALAWVDQLMDPDALLGPPALRQAQEPGNPNTRGEVGPPALRQAQEPGNPNTRGEVGPPALRQAQEPGNHSGETSKPNSSGEAEEGVKAAGAELLTAQQQQIAEQILKEVRDRLGFLADVGLGYLTLQRTASTLSGGEAQRIRLATQIGSRLVGVLYILDEPSIGLHQRDNARLISTLEKMRDLGNTLIVVEHDEETMRAADWIVDMGPGAGEHGGQIVSSGPLEEIIANETSFTGAYLSGRLSIPVPTKRREGNGKSLFIKGARANNLKNLNIEIPLGKFIVITGVSGSGKSSLIIDILHKRLAQKLHRAKAHPGKHDTILGIEHINKVIDINQSPIGRTPRSNPATYTTLFTEIRDLFANLPESKMRGYKPGRFSFNVKGGRCEACKGDGEIKIEMHFLPDIYVKCDICRGSRYNRDTLQVKYKFQSIADILDMTIEEGREFFQNIPKIRRKLETLYDVGLSYIKLGQPAPTLSGGEAQRIKLAKELSRSATGRTLYILDEPSVGLHAHDVSRLVTVLNRLVQKGNSVIVIEHNLDIIKTADWIIDLGPEGGDGGGKIVMAGTPEQIASYKHSWTGKYLAPILAASPHSDFELLPEQEYSDEAWEDDSDEEWPEEWDESKMKPVTE